MSQRKNKKERSNHLLRVHCLRSKEKSKWTGYKTAKTQQTQKRRITERKTMLPKQATARPSRRDLRCQIQAKSPSNAPMTKQQWQNAAMTTLNVALKYKTENNLSISLDGWKMELMKTSNIRNWPKKRFFVISEIWKRLKRSVSKLR